MCFVLFFWCSEILCYRERKSGIFDALVFCGVDDLFIVGK